MTKEEIFIYEKNRLDNVIDIINRQIKEAEKNFNNQEHTIIGFKEGQRGTQFIRQGLMSLYATEINNLKSVLANPYFGMFQFKDNNNETTDIYLGKKAILDENANVIAYDWRSPVCSMYYDYNIGKAEYIGTNGVKNFGEILKKRQIIIKNGELQDVEEQDTLSNDSILLKYLTENSDARLKSIIATIQREQNHIIRSPLKSDYIVQGTAGSGKTTVALHRIAYLLYNEAKSINESDFMIIGPNKYFLNYVSDLLPDLDIKNVSQFTFDEIALKNIGVSKIKVESMNKTLQELLKGEIDENIIAFKSSIEFLKLIENYINLYIDSHFKDDIVYEEIKLYSAEDIRLNFNNNMFGNDKSCKEKANELIKRLTKKIKNNSEDLSYGIWLKYRDEILNLSQDDPKRKEILEKVNKAQAEIKKGCPTVVKEYFKFLKVNPLALYQTFIENLDTIYPNEMFDIKRLQEYTNLNLSKKQAKFEDLAPLLLINYMINGVKDFKEYSYLVIDEAQDLSLAEYYMLKKLFPKAKFNVFGDVNQSIYNYQSIHNWDELNSLIFDSKANKLELNKSYRTTVNISNVSNLILRQMSQEHAECIARTGDELLLSNDISCQNIILQIKTLLDKEYQSIAIICKDDKETHDIYSKLKKMRLNISEITENNEQYNGGLCIMPSYLSKGLEFDAIIIYNANAKNYSSTNIDMKLLYAATTRAMHDLVINYDGELSLPLKSLEKKNKVLKKVK